MAITKTGTWASSCVPSSISFAPGVNPSGAQDWQITVVYQTVTTDSSGAVMQTTNSAPAVFWVSNIAGTSIAPPGLSPLTVAQLFQYVATAADQLCPTK
jgi:hypothetical protein